MNDEMIEMVQYWINHDANSVMYRDDERGQKELEMIRYSAIDAWGLPYEQNIKLKKQYTEGVWLFLKDKLLSVVAPVLSF